MPLPIYGTSSRRNNRFQILFATLIGVVMLSGVATSAEGRPEKKSSRKPAAAKAFSLPPIQGHIGDAPGPPYPAFFPNVDATGDELAFQKGVAKILCEKAESYPGREDHFGWLAENELFQKYVCRVHGLSGHILEAKSLPGGGWLVRVSVRPIVSAVGRAVILDDILEDYRYQDGVLTLVQTDAAKPKPDKHVFNLH